MSMTIVGPEVEARMDWIAASDALAAGHALPRAEVADSFLYRGKDTLLTRSAWIDGLGLAVKAATIFPGNGAQGLGQVNGGVTLYDDRTGLLEAIIDFHLLTRWKTAADSLLAARRLARPEARRVLIIGAGKVAASMAAAYRAGFPGAQVTLWNRTRATAEDLAARIGAEVAGDLAQAVAAAEIIATTTMSTTPVLHGEWLRPGTHVDLIGAYRPDMREADDAVLRRARLFVDARATTIGHIGEIEDPLRRGVITPEDIVADFYDLPGGGFARRSEDEITVAKNGGGAHLDLMMARHILEVARG
ncbi:ornithine cyclodeaminase family protein [Phaeovulum vinaykumarii]|uniref:Ornithine cyclodeaminase n=1 Tax=Phaeovulum vinaykumarii TaxID=407234 RepID=A0A1N7MLS2_9RHOB|nr:NAD(P)-binding domain-containing protein [Phaeovulum vinaykumarii]SIS87106.1 ornithine cyclodeaminase [Phaeovulum vinaykumarii]SOC13292.1 ornithine cyclodeaminase [Phaeovulum vinaykumarii]